MEFVADFNEREFEQLRRGLAAMPEKVASILGAVLLAGARPIESAAQATTRFRDRRGRLRGAIRAEKTRARFPLGDGRWISRQGAARVVVNEPYAHLVERGHQQRRSRTRGRFFLQHAYESTRPAQVAAITEALRRRIPSLARLGL